MYVLNVENFGSKNFENLNFQNFQIWGKSGNLRSLRFLEFLDLGTLRKSRVSGKTKNPWIWAEIIDIIRENTCKSIKKVGKPIFLMDFTYKTQNNIDHFIPNPFIFDFSRNPDRSEIHLF